MLAKPRSEQLNAAVIEGKDAVGFGLGPPLFDHLCKAFGLNCRQVVALGRINVEVVELPHIVIK
jgi:hypothetical protein